MDTPEDVKNLDGSTPGPYPEENEEGGGHQDKKSRGLVPLLLKETSVRSFKQSSILWDEIRWGLKV